MKLAELTWEAVERLDREIAVVVPMGALEQHGPHLPLFTDTILVTAVAEAAEAQLSQSVLLLPTQWLGASAHHLAFAGTLSATFGGYQATLGAQIQSLTRHGFRRFYVLNGHGGNTDPNLVTLRELKSNSPHLSLAHGNYWAGISDLIADTLEGPLKVLRHACEAETSLILHVRPDLVHMELAQPDGLVAASGARGAVDQFDEITERGNFGYPDRASAAKGRILFEAAVRDVVTELQRFSENDVFTAI